MEQPENKCLVDSFGRQMNYLRISVTDRCNLRCRYCAPSMPKRLKREQLLTFEEMARLVSIGTRLGISKVRLTGGEPLFRRGVVKFVAGLCRIPELKDISLTTNGTLLAGKTEALKTAGLRRLNISLDTLDREKFHMLTGADRFDDVWNGIMSATDAGFEPIKLNTVVMKGFNDNEIERLAELSLVYPFHIRFIEYMPIGTDPFQAGQYFVPSDDIAERLKRMAPLVPVAADPMGGPARRYRFKGAPGEIGLISAMSAHFCGTCNRMRLTACGNLRPCLLADDEVEVLSAIRSGASDDALAALYRRTVALKKEHHQMGFSGNRVLHTQMVSIGG